MTRPNTLRAGATPVAAIAGVCAALACNQTLPPSAPTAEPPTAPGASAEPSTAAPAPDTFAPGELRCGIDDGPVPVGMSDDDGDADDLRPRRDATAGERRRDDAGPLLGLRIAQQPPPPVNAAPPQVTVSWQLGEGLVATSAFTQRARPCGAAGQASDEGKRGFAVRFSRLGAPVAVRVDDGPGKDTTVARCFAAALCSAALATSPGERAAVGNATLTVKVVPPVFTGRAQVQLRDDRSNGPLSPGRVGRGGVPAPLPYTPAERKYLSDLQATVGKSALACAQRTPPEGRVTLAIDLTLDKRTGVFSAPKTPGRGAFERTLGSCVATAAIDSLKPPPARMMPHGGITLVAVFSPGPPPAGPAEVP